MALVAEVGNAELALPDADELTEADEAAVDPVLVGPLDAAAFESEPELQAALDNTASNAAHPASRTPIAVFLREKPTRTTFRRRPHLFGRRFRPRCVARSITAEARTGAGSQPGYDPAPEFLGRLSWWLY